MIDSGLTLITRVERTIRSECLFRPCDTLIVALSGGADSSLLLDLLTQLPGYNLHLIVAHLNHCLRGAESDGDEDFCRDLASSHSLLFEVRRTDVEKSASDLQLNLEDAGRRARIEFLDEMKIKYGAAAVVLAHHADDQAETVLMRLLRGSGMTGLSGMAYRNTRGYVRPMLDITRNQIEQYLCDHGLTWREDASNSDTVYLRNRIRHQLLPLLETYNPAIRSTLAATAYLISGDEALLMELTQQVFEQSCRVGEGGIVCGITALRSLKPALRSRVFRHAFQQLAGTLEGVSLRHSDALNDIIGSDRPNSRVALPQGVTAVREYDRLIFMLSNQAGLEADYELLITEPGCYQLPGGGSLHVELSEMVTLTTDSSTAYVPLYTTPFPWLVRTFRPGDRITPFGMSGRKKVKDVFIDRKIPLSERKKVPLLFCGDDLIWIVGVCASEKCRIDNPNANAVAAQVTWKNKEGL